MRKTAGFPTAFSTFLSWPERGVETYRVGFCLIFMMTTCSRVEARSPLLACVMRERGTVGLMILDGFRSLLSWYSVTPVL